MHAQVRFTANFQNNLDSIGDFLADADAANVFDRLITHLFDDIIPNLERFPSMGRDFLARAPQSEEGKVRRYALKSKIGVQTEIREYITDDYLILCAVQQSSVFLLSIRHHKQLSFDLRSHWL